MKISKRLCGAVCITVGGIFVMICLPSWIWLTIVGLALLIVGVCLLSHHC